MGLRRRGSQSQKRQQDDKGRGQNNEGPGSKGCEQTLEAGKGKVTAPPLDPPEGHSPADTFTVAHEAQFGLLTVR